MQNKSCLLGRLDTKGFTLIELLVVVLIIGILAAIALPQYQKAVWKSRNATLKAALKTVRQAEDAYFMANSTYTGNFDELSIDLPLTAVDMGTQSNEEICGFSIGGADAVRRGENFQIVLNTTDLANNTAIVGVWTSGPHQCKGFSMSSQGKMQCLELRPASGDFCVKIEKGTNQRQVTSFDFWDLP